MRGTTAADLPIAGWSRLSTVDWPGKLVATVFTQGCPLACTYCHNPTLIDPRIPGQVPWLDVVDLLHRRAGMLDGVVFSGGEPTMQPALPAAVTQVRELGFGVGLHTAGTYPRRLAALLPQVDWVGLDIKCTSRLYGAQTGVPAAARRAWDSLRLVLDADVAVQVRTTFDPTVQTRADLAELTAALRTAGVREHVIQQVRPDGTRPPYAAALAAVLQP